MYFGFVCCIFSWLCWALGWRGTLHTSVQEVHMVTAFLVISSQLHDSGIYLSGPCTVKLLLLNSYHTSVFIPARLKILALGGGTS